MDWFYQERLMLDFIKVCNDERYEDFKSIFINMIEILEFNLEEYGAVKTS